MENRLYTIDEVAQLMGKTPAEINEMRMQGKIYGMRDGSSWKFKGPDVEKLLHPVQEQAYDEDYALAGDSGLSLDEDPNAAEASDVMNAASLDINSTLDSSSGVSQDANVLGIGEDDLVLGESDVMSDVTLNGESSGINLYKPEGDSGISLDDNELSGALDAGSVAMKSDSLNVNLDDLVLDDDSLSIIEGASSASLPEEGNEFTLTTTPDDTEDESETGSQVIALSENSSDFSDPLMGVGPGAIEGAAEGVDMGIDSSVPAGEPGLYGGVLPPDVTPELIELAREIGKKDKPYTILNIIGLFLCIVMLTMTLIMSVDLVRNMWSWQGPYQVNSNLMDWLLSYFN